MEVAEQQDREYVHLASVPPKMTESLQPFWNQNLLSRRLKKYHFFEVESIEEVPKTVESDISRLTRSKQ